MRGSTVRSVMRWIGPVTIACSILLLWFILLYARGATDISKYHKELRQACAEIVGIGSRVGESLDGAAADSSLLYAINSVERKLSVAQGIDREYIEQTIETTSNFIGKASLFIAFVGTLFVVVNIVLVFVTRSDIREREEKFDRLLERTAKDTESIHRRISELMPEIEMQIDVKRRDVLERLIVIQQTYAERVNDLGVLLDRFIAERIGQGGAALSPDEFERILYLYSEDKSMCRDAIWYLAEHGSAGAIIYLKGLSKRTIDSELRTYALDAIAEIEGREKGPGA